MTSYAVTFELVHEEAASKARLGRLTTPHGTVETPIFMPVGTVGSVKGIEIEQLRATSTQMVLGNTYHLALRPGQETVAELGGLHKFIGWDGPMLTDSGGFQIFSLAKLAKITEHSAQFRSHIDGQLIELTPEHAVEIQEQLGADIAMTLDHVVPLPNETPAIRDACERTTRWAERCKQAHRRTDQSLFAIVQGGLDPEMRALSAEQLTAIDFPGYAIGGLSVGEPPAEMYRILDVTCPLLPTEKPRYLMGVGRPEDLLQAMLRGVDMFDCVIPTRNGRNAMAFTDDGPLRMRNSVHSRDSRPIDHRCPCPACRHSRAYLRHLFMADEMLGPILLSLHNLTYYQRLMSDARQAITQNGFRDFVADRFRGWESSTSPSGESS